MENFTKNSLKAAVSKYGPLLESASEAVLIEELKKDERGFTDEQIAEIVAAIKEPATDEQIKGEQLTSETPEWVERLIASNESVIKSNESLETLLAEIIESGPSQDELNQSVIDSNNAVIESIADFKKAAIEFLKTGDNSDRPGIKELEIDEDADYVVAAGKSFRDSKNFSKEYREGDDVTHLDNEVLKRLFNQGLITEA